METMETAQLCRILVQWPLRELAARAAQADEGASRCPGSPEQPCSSQGLHVCGEKSSAAFRDSWEHMWKIKPVLWWKSLLEIAEALEDDLHTWLFVLPPVLCYGSTDTSVRRGSAAISIRSVPREQGAYPVCWR